MYEILLSNLIWGSSWDGEDIGYDCEVVSLYTCEINGVTVNFYINEDTVDGIMKESDILAIWIDEEE